MNDNNVGVFQVSGNSQVQALIDSLVESYRRGLEEGFDAAATKVVIFQQRWSVEKKIVDCAAALGVNLALSVGKKNPEPDFALSFTDLLAISHLVFITGCLDGNHGVKDVR